MNIHIVNSLNNGSIKKYLNTKIYDKTKAKAGISNIQYSLFYCKISIATEVWQTQDRHVNKRRSLRRNTVCVWKQCWCKGL